MPSKVEVKDFLKEGDDDDVVLRPLFCYYSQYDSNMLKIFVTDEEKEDIYLEKPLPARELASLLRLINVL